MAAAFLSLTTTNSALSSFYAGCTSCRGWSTVCSVSPDGALPPCTRRGHFQGAAFDPFNVLFSLGVDQVVSTRWNAGRSLMLAVRKRT